MSINLEAAVGILGRKLEAGVSAAEPGALGSEPLEAAISRLLLEGRRRSSMAKTIPDPANMTATPGPVGPCRYRRCPSHLGWFLRVMFQKGLLHGDF